MIRTYADIFQYFREYDIEGEVQPLLHPLMGHSLEVRYFDPFFRLKSNKCFEEKFMNLFDMGILYRFNPIRTSSWYKIKYWFRNYK